MIIKVVWIGIFLQDNNTERNLQLDHSIFSSFSKCQDIYNAGPDLSSMSHILSMGVFLGRILQWIFDVF